MLKKGHVVVSLFLSAYLILALIGRFLYFLPPKPLPVLVTLVMWAGLVLGYKYPIRIPKGLMLGAMLSCLFFLSQFRPIWFLIVPLITASFFSIKWLLRTRKIRIENHRTEIWALLLSLGAATFLYGFINSGFPILRPEAKYDSAAQIFGAGTFFLVLSVVMSKRLDVFIFAEALAFLSAFRSYYLVIMASYFFSSEVDRKKAVAIVAMFFLLAVLGHSAAGEERGIALTGYIIERASFTYGVYMDLVGLSLPFGMFHGTLIFSRDPRALISSLFGRSGRYTYFLFGQPVADFGAFGVLETFLMGSLLRESEYTIETRAISLAYALLAIETGVDVFTLGILLGCNYAVGELKSVRGTLMT